MKLEVSIKLNIYKAIIKYIKNKYGFIPSLIALKNNVVIISINKKKLPSVKII